MQICRRTGIVSRVMLGVLTAWLGAVLAGWTPAYASEGGGSSYLPGFQDTLAGVLPPPGWYTHERLIYFTSNTRQTATATLPELNLHLQDFLSITTVEQVTSKTIWGANYAWEVLILFTNPLLEGRFVPPTAAPAFDKQITAQADPILVPFQLGWQHGDSHHRVLLAVYTNWGNFNINNPVNAGKNHWGVELDYAYTYLDTQSGHELSLSPGYTVNFINPATHYVSGQEFHLDYTLMHHFPSGLGAGLAGYYFQQTTGDSGTGAIRGAFKGRTEAIGPIVSNTVNVGRTPVLLIGKYQTEFAVQNRFQGHSYWAIAKFPF